MAELPGAELYTQRVSKAAEIPPASRSADCAAFLAAHSLLEEAAAVLLPSEDASSTQQELERAGAPAGPDEEGDQAKQLALLKWLSAGTGVGRAQPLPLPHPRLDSAAGTAAALAPMVRLDPTGGSSAAGGRGSDSSSAAAGRSAAKLVAGPQLEPLLQPDGPLPSLQELCASLLLARFWLRQGEGRQARRALTAAARCFGLEARSLRQQEAEAELAAQTAAFRASLDRERATPAAPAAPTRQTSPALAAQLAALQSAGGGTSGWQAPSADDLHAVLLHLRLEACMPEPGFLERCSKRGEVDEQGAPQPRGEGALLAAQRTCDMHALLTLRPDDARSHEWAAAVGQAAVGFASHPVFLGLQKRDASFRGPVQHLQRMLQLAQASGSQVQAAKAGYQLGRLLVEAALGLLQCNINPTCTSFAPSYVTVSPAETAAYLQAADAALEACKPWAPFAWLAELRAARAEAAAVRPHLQKQIEHRPQSWSYLDDEVGWS